MAVDEAALDVRNGDAPRNIVTGGMALNHLVERQLAVRQVALLGLRLCEPCVHLAELTNKGISRGLVGRRSAFLTTPKSGGEGS